MFAQLGESVAVARNAGDILAVYLIYNGRFFLMGSPASVARLSLHALSESIALAKRHLDFGIATLPGASVEYHKQPELVPPPWLQQLEQPEPAHRSRPTVPLARLHLPVSALQQMLQLPPDYDIRRLAIEDGGLAVYCLTPECQEMSVTWGQPVIQAEYQTEERDGASWRRLLSVAVEPAKEQR